MKFKFKIRRKPEDSVDKPVEKEKPIEEKVEQVVGKAVKKPVEKKPITQTIKQEKKKETEIPKITKKKIEKKEEKPKEKVKPKTQKKEPEKKKEEQKKKVEKTTKEEKPTPEPEITKEKVKLEEPAVQIKKEEKPVPKPEIIKETIKVEEPKVQIKEEESMLKPEEIAETVKLDEPLVQKKVQVRKIRDKPKIMIVDDEHDVLSSVEKVLKSSNYDVISLDSGEKCFDHLKRGEVPDLIVLDIMMPVLSGWEVQRRLERNIDWKDIPIIFLTARTTDAAKEMCKRLGADYVIKPFDINDLKTRIERVLKEKSNQ